MNNLLLEKKAALESSDLPKKEDGPKLPKLRLPFGGFRRICLQHSYPEEYIRILYFKFEKE
jgi:hypothetical protein